MRNHPYIFGYKNGITPELAQQIWAENAVNKLLSNILTPEQMIRRENIRLFQEAINQVAMEIVDRYWKIMEGYGNI